jgi:cyclase
VTGPRPRFIPVLLLSGRGLVKGTRFTDHDYIGDPINTMRIFSDKFADEVVLLDIDARREGRTPDLELVTRIADECYMPLAVGGGISRLEDVEQLIRSGVEKVVLNTAAMDHPELVAEVANRFGSQSVTVAVDYREKAASRYVTTRNGTQAHEGTDPLEWAQAMVAAGAGEIILSSIDRDGTRSGLDLELISRATGRLTVPVVALGGAASVGDLHSAAALHASAAAGSLFVHFGRRRSVLITYPLSGRDL